MAAKYTHSSFLVDAPPAARLQGFNSSRTPKGTQMERFSALIGFVLILAIAWALSNNKHAIRWKTVFWGLLLQIFIAIAVLKGEPISRAIVGANPPITRAMASLIFIVAAILFYLIAKRMKAGA